MPFELTCSAFKDGELIPKRHTCDGEDLSPPLRWNHPPAGTRSFVLIADDFHTFAIEWQADQIDWFY
ncbi:MAG: hypothetical protein WAS50_10640, partial [Nitrospira sp.]